MAPVMCLWAAPTLYPLNNNEADFPLPALPNTKIRFLWYLFHVVG